MKKIILLTLIVLGVFGLGTFGVSAKTVDSGKCGANLTWMLDNEGVLTIGGNGAMYDYDTAFNCSPWMRNESIKTVIIGDKVTSIGNLAFFACDGIKSITIPDNVTSIGENAFNSCSNLASITIGTGVTSIGEGAFGYCYNLKRVDISDLSAWCRISFCETGATTNPLVLTHNLYLNGILVTDLIIPDGVTSIGDSAFRDCSGIKSITIPDSVTSIGAVAFAGCNSLKSITIPDSVTSIGAAAFSDCDGLTSITIPGGVTIIANNTFIGCNNLASVTIGTGVTNIGSAFSGCNALTSITIPDSVTSIGDYAFSGCSSLTDVYYNATEIEWNVISIGSHNEHLINATIHFKKEYYINEITIKDMSGNRLQAIPIGTFLATVSFTNLGSNADNVIILAQYTDAGAFKGLMYIQTEDVPTGSTIKLSIPVDNTSGDITKLKAFSWESFGSLIPMGNSASFPTE